jgi:hypothetical protein
MDTKQIKGITLRRRLAVRIGRSYFVRFHMFMILLATGLTGLLCSKGLLHIGVSRMAVRYGIAIVVSYLLFFLFTKLWLLYIGIGSHGGLSNDKGESSSLWPDFIPSPGGSDAGAGAGGSFRGFGGGSSGGGGAARSIIGGDTLAGAIEGASADPGVSDGVGEVAGQAVGGALDVGDDFGLALIAIILLAALALSSVVVSVYLIWSAPAILSEAAFQVLLVTSFAGKVRQAEKTGWEISVFKATWWGFLLVLTFSVAFGVIAQKANPAAITVKDFFVSTKW